MIPQILAIDDSPEIHLLLAARLRPENVQLHQALDAEEGLAKAAALQPDLVLLDVDMPGADGFELCARLKADPRTSMLQVIFLTGTSEVTSKVRGFDVGATDYVTKPFDAAELRARVRAALRTKRYQDLLATRAQIDGLTGVFNRGFLDQRLADEVARWARYGNAFSVVMADLDHFKKINDTFGHPFGDQVIQAFAEVLLGEARVTDAVCRYGGEEFVVLLPETPAEGALSFIERARARFAERELRPSGLRVSPTASFGVADTTVAPPGQLTASLLISRADDALYTAKRAGRDCARVAESATPKPAKAEA